MIPYGMAERQLSSSRNFAELILVRVVTRTLHSIRVASLLRYRISKDKRKKWSVEYIYLGRIMILYSYVSVLLCVGNRRNILSASANLSIYSCGIFFVS
jgi:hypothetical protein